MNRVERILKNIEGAVEEGKVKKGDAIRIPDLPEDLLILVEACFAGKRGYKMRRVAIMSYGNSPRLYDLELKLR